MATRVYGHVAANRVEDPALELHGGSPSAGKDQVVKTGPIDYGHLTGLTAQRMEVVAALHAEGMSKRAIAAGIGVNDRTVRRDLEDSGAAHAAPESDDVIEAEIVNDDEVEEERVNRRRW